MMMLVVAVLALMTCSVTAQVPALGRCPMVPVQSNFNLESYLGTWYEYEKFFAIFELGNKCNQANYSMKADGHVKVLNQALGRSVVGDAMVMNASEPAKLGVKFYWWQPRGNYWVLLTDYETYAVVWSCSSIWPHLIHTEIAWVLTRRRGVLSQDRETYIHNQLSEWGINPAKFTKTEQMGCPEP